MPIFDSNHGTARVPGSGGAGSEVRIAGLEVTVKQGPGAGATAALAGASLIVGSGAGCDLKLADPAVAPQHLVLSISSEGIQAEDLASVSGTWMGAARIRSAQVASGALITVGKTVLDVRASTRRLLAMRSSRTRLGGLVGSSTPMQEIYGLVEPLARTDLPLMVVGEPGAGKRTLARALHDAGARRGRPFVVMDCRGAGTGALAQLAEVRGGTLLVHEIGALDAPLQLPLLRALETRQLNVSGDHVTLDLRVVASSSQELAPLADQGRVRSDLLYRLGAVTIWLPPLAERRGDIPALIEHFIRAHRDRSGPRRPLPPHQLEELASRAWPGNVRELERAVQSLLDTPR